MTLAIPLETLNSFVMPTVRQGAIVRFYPSGRRTARQAEVATVLRVSDRSVVLRIESNVRMDTVRHVDDPKLNLNRDQRETGAWDFTEEHYERAAWFEQVDKRLKSLESKAVSKVINKAREESPASSYHTLRRKAKQLGVVFSGNPRKEWLVEKIEELSDGRASTGGDSQDVVGKDRDSEKPQA